MNSRILAFPCDNVRACEEPHQAGTEAGFKKTTPVLFPIPVLPRSTKRREGNVAMLQVERSARVLDRRHENTGSQGEHCFPRPTAPCSQTQLLWRARPLHRQSLLPRKAMETAQETKASGLVVWWQNRLLHTGQKEVRTALFFLSPNKSPRWKRYPQSPLSKRALFRGKTACDQAHTASGWRGRFPGLHFGTEAFLQTHEQMHPNPHVLLQKYTAVSLYWENRFAVRRTVMWPTHPSLV